MRRAVGDDVCLMVDANQALDFPEAVRRGRAYEEAGMFWFEEPMPPYMVENHARLCQTLDIPVDVYKRQRLKSASPCSSLAQTGNN